MKYKPLGRTNMQVSEICLGSMTWGSQNSQAEANEQLDYAKGRGINFIDTAEMYPTTPRSADTIGLTEEILGNWMATQSDRDQLVIATKATGEGNMTVRNGARVTGAILREALEGSLKRLRTDVVDLYQLHWANRGSYHFRKNWHFDPNNLDVGDMDQEIADLLGEVGKLQQEGKVKAFGLSNESAWGVMKFIQASEQHDLPRIASIQNEYNLICRFFDLDLSEVCILEDIGLMAYSPLSAGALCGKYNGGNVPPGSRLTIQPGLYGRYNDRSKIAIEDYCKLAETHGLDPAQMAIAFCLTRPFMMSPIIGATNMEQLRANIDAADIALNDEVQAGILELYKKHPVPM